MTHNDVSWFDWLVFAFCWSLPVLLWMVRRWRVRVFISLQDPLQDDPAADPGRLGSGSPVGANPSAALGTGSAKDRSQRGRWV